MATQDRASPPTPSVLDRVIRPLRDFLRHKLAGAGLLVLATLAALAWANSGWSGSYEELLESRLTVGTSWAKLEKPILLWVNDALMGIFFFLVGLEIKRELVAGDLRSPKKAMLPLAAAIGGMLTPALLYALLNFGRPEVRGWGIPMATDIAFALGVLALLGDRIPVGLKVFLTALAIVDDIGCIVVIALFYSEDLSALTLALGGLLLLLSLACNRAGVRSALPYFLLGTLAWLAFLKSGVHATLAAVLMAFTIPARAKTDAEGFAARMKELLDVWKLAPADDTPLLTHEQQYVADEMAEAVEQATAPLQRLEHALVPVASFLVLPVFALANAGVRLVGDTASTAVPMTVGLGIVLGLVIGKPLGVVAFSFAAVRLGLADLPRGVTWRQLIGTGFLAGIGFTMALFVASLAFDDPALVATAKGSILLASIAAATIGVVLLLKRTTAREET